MPRPPSRQIFLFLTVMFSYMVNTWLVETMSTVSALQQQSDNNTREPVNFASNWMEQHGSMVLVVLPRWGQILWFVTIVLYLFGDLAVYAGETCTHTVCVCGEVQS